MLGKCISLDVYIYIYIHPHNNRIQIRCQNIRHIFNSSSGVAFLLCHHAGQGCLCLLSWSYLLPIALYLLYRSKIKILTFILFRVFRYLTFFSFPPFPYRSNSSLCTSQCLASILFRCFRYLTFSLSLLFYSGQIHLSLSLSLSLPLFLYRSNSCPSLSIPVKFISLSLSRSLLLSILFPNGQPPTFLPYPLPPLSLSVLRTGQVGQGILGISCATSVLPSVLGLGTVGLGCYAAERAGKRVNSKRRDLTQSERGSLLASGHCLISDWFFMYLCV